MKSLGRIGRHRPAAHHAHFGIGHGRNQRFDGVFQRQGVGAFQYDHFAIGVPQQQIDGRGLAFLARLSQQPDARVDGRILLHDVFGPVRATAGHDDDFVDGDFLRLLDEQRLQEKADIRLFIVGHDADAAVDHGGLRVRGSYDQAAKE